MKFFTIFLVIVGHVTQQTAVLSCVPIQEDPLFRLIYTSHMPLFMGISGYFFCKSVYKSASLHNYVKNKLKKRLLGLFIPMLSFGVLKSIWALGWGWPAFYPEQVKRIWFLGDLAINTLLVLGALYFCNGIFRHDLKYFFVAMLFSAVPKIGYGSDGLFMYIFFVLGFFIARYKVNTSFYLKYWKFLLMSFVMIYLVFSMLLPWPPQNFTLDFSHQSILNIVIIDIFKVILGGVGSYLILVSIYYLMPRLSHTSLGKNAIKYGAYTLDIYLLQILFVEMTFGPMYKHWVNNGGIDFMNIYGIGIRTIAIVLFSILLLKIILLISDFLNRSTFLTKLFFYR